MSALGQKQTCAVHTADVRFTLNSDRESGFPQKACPLCPPKQTCAVQLEDVGFVPIADITSVQESNAYFLATRREAESS